jgi:hypothetical protein
MKIESIKEYILKELEQIKTPISQQLYVFKELNYKVDLLFTFLEFEIPEKDLSRVNQNFINHFKDIYTVDKLPNVIEGLATNFEPFLKKIGFIKYSGTTVWEGDEKSKGIKGTMLARLCSGTLEPTNRFQKEKIFIPDSFFENDILITEIVNFVKEIRNSVHQAKAYNNSELYYNLNLILSCYLFAIEKSSLQIKIKILPEYIYLSKIINEKSFLKLEILYVDLIGYEIEDIDIMGYEVLDEFKLLKSIQDYSFDEAEEDNTEIDLNNSLSEQRVDSIINISNDTSKLAIIAPPGTGKTTTLHKILYSNANKIIEGNNDIKFPFYIAANEFKTYRTFKNILYAQVNEQWVNSALNKGNIQLLIDGINEIKLEFKYDALNEIKEIIKEYPNISLIITDRKYGFEKLFDFPTFEIKELSDNQIKDFISKFLNFSDIEKIWNEFDANRDMLQLGRNPLMLKMILSVLKDNSIPANRGQLYQLFIQTIFIREEQKKKQFDREQKSEILSKIAFLMRESGNISWSTQIFKNYIKNIIDENNLKISSTTLFKELLDNYLIKSSIDDDVSFLHETYQEYFCANYLNEKFNVSRTLDIDLGNSIWYEPLLICHDLFKNIEKKNDFFKYLFRGQEEAKTVKEFVNFDESDLNSNVFIACNLANKHQSFNNEVYQNCEVLLGNYLSILKIVFIKHKKWIVPLENLFASIAALNSKKIFSRIFLDPDWVEVWLYFERRDTEKDESVRFIDYFTSLSKIIILNTKSLSVILPIIKNSINEYAWSKPILENLNLLYKNLLLNASIDDLLEIYESDKQNENVFFIILQNNFDFIYEYSFERNDIVKNSKILNNLLKYHHNNIKCREFIIEKIAKTKYNNNTYKTLFNRFFYYEYLTECNKIAELLLSQNNYDTFDELRIQIQTIPFELLSPTIKGCFVADPINFNIPIEFKNCNNSSMSIFLLNDCYHHIVKKAILNNNTFHVTSGFAIKPISIDHVIVSTNILFTVIPVDLNDLQKVPYSGTVSFLDKGKEYTYKYEKFEISRSGDKINIEINRTFSNQNLPVNSIVYLQKYLEFRYIGLTINKVHTNKSELKIKSFKNDSIFNSLIINNYNFDYENDKFFHPDLFKNTYYIQKFQNDLKNENLKEHTKKFIKSLGLSYLVHEELQEIKYGVIVNIYKNFLKIYLLYEGLFIDRFVNDNKSHSYQLYDYIILEQNNTIQRLILKNNFDIGFLESEIISINFERNEGFIYFKNKKSYADSDYYFKLSNCNFRPQTGDRVSFLPIKNFSSNHQNQPVAVNILKIKVPVCKISEINIDADNKVTGIAIDVEKNEILHFALNTYVMYTLNNNEEMKVGDEFEYSSLRIVEAPFYHLIKFIKRRMRM